MLTSDETLIFSLRPANKSQEPAIVHLTLQASHWHRDRETHYERHTDPNYWLSQLSVFRNPDVPP